VAYGFAALGSFHDDTAEFAQAQLYYERALKIWEALGSSSRDVGATRTNLANLLRRTGDFAGSLLVRRRSVTRCPGR
jgi:hypothetical protein